MRHRSLTVTAALLALPLIAGCGGEEEAEVQRSSSVAGGTRIERCVERYPDSTKAECEEWEADEQLADDGSHREHEE